MQTKDFQLAERMNQGLATLERSVLTALMNCFGRRMR